MSEKPYEWSNGAILQDHSHQKHKILGEYIIDYLITRCRIPQQERFRLAIIDGFAGGGVYRSGEPGSPSIFLEKLTHALESVNTYRAVNGLKLIDVECLLVMNDKNPEAINLLKNVMAPLQINIKNDHQKLHVTTEYLNSSFEQVYPKIKEFLKKNKFRNVIFNLDQCGHSQVNILTIKDIMTSFTSAEIIYTFAIESLLAFLQKSNPKKLQEQLNYLNINMKYMDKLQEVMNRKEWLGMAEKMVFDVFHSYAPFVSPFSINNPDGWRYWLIHFANNYRARQVYNNILHAHGTMQAHYGRAGLNMLTYDHKLNDGKLYLFEDDDRALAKEQLLEDIPRLIAGDVDTWDVLKFYKSIYNATPSHTDDIHDAISKHPDLEVITSTGGKRRKPNTIKPNDIIQLKPQRSFFLF